VQTDLVDDFAEARRHRDAERVGQPFLCAPREVDERRRIAEHDARLRQQHGAFRRQLHAGRRADEELHAELVFELTDVAAERRLRDVEMPCSPGEAARLGDRRELAKMMQVHQA